MTELTSSTLLGRPLHEIVAEIAAGKVAVTELQSDVADAVDAHRQLNAIVGFDKARLLSDAAAMEERFANKASGILHGIPVLLKDNINTNAYVTSAGTPSLLDNVPLLNAPLVERLHAAGALVGGKGNMHELSSGCTSANHSFGAVGNPYNLSRIPGGSSGGVAAAVAARIFPAGIGTDTAGSVRAPAALCGVIGFRPSVGRYPTDGVVPLSSKMDTPGPIARSMQDILLLDAALTGKTAVTNADRPTTIRLGVAADWVNQSSEEVAITFRRALGRLEAAGVQLTEIELEPLRDLHRAAMDSVVDTEFPEVMTSYLAAHAPTVSLDRLVESIASPAVRNFTVARIGKKPTPDAYAKAISEGRDNLRAAWQSLMNQHSIDSVVFPTTPEIALPLAHDDSVQRDGGEAMSWFYLNHTSYASAGSRPGITLPIGLSPSGMPVGLEMDGLPGEDESLLALATSVEHYLPSTPAPIPQY